MYHSSPENIYWVFLSQFWSSVNDCCLCVWSEIYIIIVIKEDEFIFILENKQIWSIQQIYFHHDVI